MSWKIRRAAHICLGLAFIAAGGLLSLSRADRPAKAESHDWPVYGGQAAGDHYSSLSQINRKNVRRLQVAWTYDAGEEGGLESSPIVVGRVLYAYTATQKVVALDAATGKLIWQFDSGIHGKNPIRGRSY